MAEKRSEIKELDKNGKHYKIEYLGESLDGDKPTKKVIIIGLTGVGKSTISHYLIKNEFKHFTPTINLDIAGYKLRVNKTIIQFQIWDTCGNENYVISTPFLFKDTFLAIIVYAIDNKTSFEDVEKWYNILRDQSLTSLVYLIGNKNDLEEKRQVQKHKAEELRQKYDFKFFIETSAKSGSNIKALLDQIAIEIYDKKGEENEKEEKFIIEINEEEEIKIKRKKKCCQP